MTSVDSNRTKIEEWTNKKNYNFRIEFSHLNNSKHKKYSTISHSNPKMSSKKEVISFPSRVRLKFQIVMIWCLFLQFGFIQNSQIINVCKWNFYCGIYSVVTVFVEIFIRLWVTIALNRLLILSFRIVFINELGNYEANRAATTVLNYVAETPSLGISIQLNRIHGNRSEPKLFLKERMWILVCSNWIQYKEIISCTMVFDFNFFKYSKCAPFTQTPLRMINRHI